MWALALAAGCAAAPPLKPPPPIAASSPPGPGTCLGGVVLDASTNAAVLEKGPAGWTVIYAEKADLSFPRGANSITTLLTRPPGLRARLGR